MKIEDLRSMLLHKPIYSRAENEYFYIFGVDFVMNDCIEVRYVSRCGFKFFAFRYDSLYLHHVGKEQFLRQILGEDKFTTSKLAKLCFPELKLTEALV